MAVPEYTACDPWQAYVGKDTGLLMLPTEKATQSIPLQAWSYVKIIGEYKDFYYASCDAGEGFLAKALCLNAEYTLETVASTVFTVEEATELYAEPLPNAAISGQLSAGTEWTTETMSSNGWYYVEAQDIKGFVPPEKATVYRKQYWKETKYIRQTMDENARVVGSIPMNTIVDTSVVNNHWTKVSVDGIVGYVRTAGIA